MLSTTVRASVEAMYGTPPTVVVLSSCNHLLARRVVVALRGRVRAVAALDWEEAEDAIDKQGADAIVCELHAETPEEISRLAYLQRRYGVGVTVLPSRLSSQSLTSLVSRGDLELDVALLVDAGMRGDELRWAVERSLRRSARRRILCHLASREQFAPILPLAAACLEAAPSAGPAARTILPGGGTCSRII